MSRNSVESVAQGAYASEHLPDLIVVPLLVTDLLQLRDELHGGKYPEALEWLQGVLDYAIDAARRDKP